MTPMFGACDFAKKLEAKATRLNYYEVSALNLSKENRGLIAKISNLEFEIQELKVKNNFLKLALENKKSKEAGKTVNRSIASVIPSQKLANDMVDFETYKWSPDQLLAVGEREFVAQNFEKSAQFLNAFCTEYPKHKNLDDQMLFKVGVASYKSGKYYDWANAYLGKLVQEYPTSKYYRGAKLWMALTNLKVGKEDDFYKTVEEFRLKYRNTPEWTILAGYYEAFTNKYKK